MMLKYLGTPITPRAVLHTLAGMNFCVSYAAPGDIEWCDAHAQSLLLDNGAFSFWRTGKATDWDGYYAWCERWLERNTTWAVIPDVIGGMESENDRLIAEWPFEDRGAPVYHMHEDIDRFQMLCRDWPLVCIGSSAEFAIVGSPSWHRRMRELFNAVVSDDGSVPRLHMLRGLDFADGPYPFYSADSTNVARNHAGTNQGRRKRSARLMADEVNGRNPARLWVPPVEQMELAA